MNLLAFFQYIIAKGCDPPQVPTLAQVCYRVELVSTSSAPADLHLQQLLVDAARSSRGPPLLRPSIASSDYMEKVERTDEEWREQLSRPNTRWLREAETDGSPPRHRHRDGPAFQTAARAGTSLQVRHEVPFGIGGRRFTSGRRRRGHADRGPSLGMSGSKAAAPPAIRTLGTSSPRGHGTRPTSVVHHSVSLTLEPKMTARGRLVATPAAGVIAAIALDLGRAAACLPGGAPSRPGRLGGDPGRRRRAIACAAARRACAPGGIAVHQLAPLALGRDRRPRRPPADSQAGPGRGRVPVPAGSARRRCRTRARPGCRSC